MGPVLRFTLIAYAITWTVLLPSVLDGLGWTALGVPSWWHGFGAFGPLAAAYLMRRAENPRTRLRDLYRRQGQPNVGPAWVLLFMGTPLVFLVAGILVARLTGDPPAFGALLDAAARPAWLLNLAIASIAYGLGEEPGWRGWLLPRLQEGHGALAGTLVLSVIWAIWHVPFFAYRYDLMGAGMIAGFFIALMAGAFWLTFVFNSTGGSVWTVALWHLFWNFCNLVAAELSVTVVTVLNALMMVAGFAVVVVWGRRGLAVAPRSARG